MRFRRIKEPCKKLSFIPLEDRVIEEFEIRAEIQAKVLWTWIRVKKYTFVDRRVFWLKLQ